MLVFTLLVFLFKSRAGDNGCKRGPLCLLVLSCRSIHTLVWSFILAFVFVLMLFEGFLAHKGSHSTLARWLGLWLESLVSLEPTLLADDFAIIYLKTTILTQCVLFFVSISTLALFFTSVGFTLASLKL